MSKTYETKSMQIGLSDGWDVIVAGGGPAGCTAATAAARKGAKVLLLERTGALGGMGTMGLVPAWCPFSDGIRLVYQGLAEHVLRETMKGMPHLSPEQVNWTPIDPERLKIVYDDMVLGSGAQVLFETFVCGVEKDEKQNIKAILAANKNGIEAFSAKVFIDCTGDADLATWGGAPYEKGGENGVLQAATHCFMLSNVNQYAYNYEQVGATIHSQMIKLAESGKYPLITD
ncbi:MAG: FAD-dependent oxidoreductase, partial [Lentisphaerae bacterium]|nr:FAD-dependent oxidoreductase [Lentisphaerota bacterium]